MSNLSNERLRDLTVFIFVSMIAIISFGLVISFMINKKVVYETFDIIIAFLGLFTTLIGAYLGASVAGKKAIETINIERENEKKDKIAQIQNVLLFNNVNLLRIFSEIFTKYEFDNEKAKQKLNEYKKVEDNKNINYDKCFNELTVSPDTKGSRFKLSSDVKRDIDSYNDLLTDMSWNYHHLLIRINEIEDDKYYINLLSMLKQKLNILSKFIADKEGKFCVILNNSETRSSILNCFDSLIEVNDEIAKVNTDVLMKKLN